MPDIGDGNYEGKVIRITDLAVTRSVLEDYRFVDCVIHGPAVLVPLGDIVFDTCNWNSPQGLDALFWDIPAEREWVIGGIAVVNCHFVRCDFRGVGIAGSADLKEALEQGATG